MIVSVSVFGAKYDVNYANYDLEWCFYLGTFYENPSMGSQAILNKICLALLKNISGGIFEESNE